MVRRDQFRSLCLVTSHWIRVGAGSSNPAVIWLYEVNVFCSNASMASARPLYKFLLVVLIHATEDGTEAIPLCADNDGCMKWKLKYLCGHGVGLATETLSWKLWLFINEVECEASELLRHLRYLPLSLLFHLGSCGAFVVKSVLLLVRQDFGLWLFPVRRLQGFRLEI